MQYPKPTIATNGVTILREWPIKDVAVQRLVWRTRSGRPERAVLPIVNESGTGAQVTGIFGLMGTDILQSLGDPTAGLATVPKAAKGRTCNEAPQSRNFCRAGPAYCCSSAGTPVRRSHWDGWDPLNTDPDDRDPAKANLGGAAMDRW
jgi:hypothetical protein